MNYTRESTYDTISRYVSMATREGRQAYRDGKPIDSCPHTEQFQRDGWLRGYNDEKESK